jgi:hypothetical protein
MPARWNMDETVENADWTKVRADLPTERDEFFEMLARHGLSVEEFQRLPVYKFNRDHYDKLLSED